jgi:COP9 signalosome complex subunit 5
MTHCHSGVEKGVKKGGNPIEVMGLLLGRPDPITPHTLVVTDVFPLPIEGFETRVIADDGDVINHMIELGESLEATRREKFMGWYHSHPFDVGPHSHCYMSQTDISTQLQWQRAEDPHGNPFLAIVVDPLRSLARGDPELKAFRAYPPEYTHPVVNQCPNGEILHEERARLEQWGSCWASYYELEVEYYMSGGARGVLSTLTRNFLWMRTLGTTPTCEAESRIRCVDGVVGAAERLARFQPAGGGGAAGSGGAGDAPSALLGSRGGVGRVGPASSGASPRVGEGGSGDRVGRPSSSSSTPAAALSGGKEDEDELAKSCQAVIDIATEKLIGSIAQTVKRELFTQR